MVKNKNGLPDRWLKYTSLGQQIRGVPIIACKVPLKEDMIRYKIKEDKWFTPEILVKLVPNVGCIVDLTATDRYYNPSVFTERGIHHAKIFCEGHVIPKPTTVNSFFRVLDDFLHNVKSRGKVLMVHCTHGLNRTGYLVSRYLIERRGYKPEAAIEAFNQARGHNIERANYLQDLRARKSLICRYPIPLFKGGPRPDHQEQTAASYDRPISSNGHHLAQGGRSHDHPPPFPDFHQPPPPVVAPSFVPQLTEPSHGQHHLNWRQGPSSGARNFYVDHVNSQSTATFQGRNNSPLPLTDSYGAGHHLRPAQHPYAPAPVMPLVPVHDYSQPPPPIINKLPNLKWIVTENPSVQLNNYSDDRPNSANRHRSASRSQGRGASPVDAGRRKQRLNHSTPPPSSSSEHRRESRHRRFDDQSVDDRSTSSTGISNNWRRADPPGQRDGRCQDSKAHSHSGRSSRRDHPFDRPGESSSSSRQDFSSDRGAPRKKERRKRRRAAERSAERS